MSIYKIEDITNCAPVNMDFNGVSLDISSGDRILDFEDGDNWGVLLCAPDALAEIKELFKNKHKFEIPEFFPDLTAAFKEKEKEEIEKNEMEYDGNEDEKQQMNNDVDQQKKDEANEPSSSAANAAFDVG